MRRLRSAPIFADLATASSITIASIAALAAATAMGAAENVEVCRKGSLSNGAYASAVATAAATGTTPPDSPLPTSMMSGETTSGSWPHQRPSRPRPVRISSSTRNAPYSVRILPSSAR